MAAISALNPHVNSLNRIHSSADKSIRSIASGSKLFSAAVSPSDYAIAARLSSNIRASSQSVQNTQNISAMFKIAEGATRNTIDALSSIKSLLINAANDSNSNPDRAALQDNINQLVAQIDLNANANYNGKSLLDGSLPALSLAGIDGYENFSLTDLRANALGLTDSQGNVNIDASTVESAYSSLPLVDNALTVAGNSLNSTQFAQSFADPNSGFAFDRALDAATSQGAFLQRLDFQQANYTTMEENMLEAQSTIADADIANLIAHLQNQHTLQHLATFATNLFNHNQANVLRLLQ